MSSLVLISGCVLVADHFGFRSVTSSHAYMYTVGPEFTLSQRLFGAEPETDIEFCAQSTVNADLELLFDCRIPSESSQKIIEIVGMHYERILSNREFIRSTVAPNLLAKKSCVYIVQAGVSFREIREIDDCFHLYFSYEGYFDDPKWQPLEASVKEFLFLAGIFGTLSHERFHFYYSRADKSRRSVFKSFDSVGEEFLGYLVKLTVFHNTLDTLDAFNKDFSRFPESNREDQQWMIDLCNASEAERLNVLKGELPTFLGIYYVEQLVASNVEKTKAKTPHYVDAIYRYATQNDVTLEVLSQAYCQKVRNGQDTVFDRISSRFQSPIGANGY